MQQNTIKNFGVIVEQLDRNPRSHLLLTNLNNIVTEHSNYSPTIFYQNVTQPPIGSCCVKMHYMHSWNYDGVLISTSLPTTVILGSNICAKKKYFYVYDLEWMFLQKPIFKQINGLYNNPDIELIARSQSHYDLLTKLWKEPVAIVDNFKYTDLMKLLEK